MAACFYQDISDMLGEDQTVGMAEKIDVSCAGCISHLRKARRKTINKRIPI
jgi:hypothetical protein